METKRCTKCGTEKSIIDFYVSATKAGTRRLNSWCKVCCSALAKRGERRRLANPEYRAKYNLRKNTARRERYVRVKSYHDYVLQRNHQRAQELKDRVFAAYGGYRCACCEETTVAFLSVDHVENNGAEHRRMIGKGGAPTYRWLVKNGFPDGFQVLCHNCNIGKYRNNGVCPHQTSEGSTTSAQARTPQAIGGGSAGLPHDYVWDEEIVWTAWRHAAASHDE